MRHRHYFRRPPPARRPLQLECLEDRRLLAAELYLPVEQLAPEGLATIVDLGLRDAAGLLAMDLTIRYDSAKLAWNEAHVGGLLQGIGSWAQNLTADDDSVEGLVRLSTFDATPLVNGTGVPLQLSFTARLGSSGVAVLDVVSDAAQTALNEGQMPVEITDGSLLVRPAGAALVGIPTNLAAAVGGDLVVPVTIDDARNWLSADLVLDYDAALLDVVSVNLGAVTASRGWALEVNSAEDGRLRISMFDTDAYSGNGEILRVTMRVANDAAVPATSSLDLSQSQTTLNEGGQAVVTRDGQVSIVAAGWRNPRNPLDVNDDGSVSPIDALMVINELNEPFFTDSQFRLPAARPSGPATQFPYLDVNGDGFASPIDALLVINFLNEQAGPEGEWSGLNDASGLEIPSADSPFSAATNSGWHWPPPPFRHRLTRAAPFRSSF